MSVKLLTEHHLEFLSLKGGCTGSSESRLVKMPTEHHLEFLSLKGGCTGSSESRLVKMPHCWKSHVVAQLLYFACYQSSGKLS